MFYQLPPVGSPIRRARGGGEMPEAVFSPYSARFYASGTAALAAAVVEARQARAAVERPEVLLPAYACPDLVSAVLYAGAQPVLIDLEVGRPWMNLDEVSERIGENTVAVIAVHLFGILERVDALKALASRVGALLIEDSAQAFPGAEEAPFWRGDRVILSFGRGKPVSVLGGGAMLSREHAASAQVPSPGPLARIKRDLKVTLYNALIHPRLYWSLRLLPFLHLGQTRYHPLPAIGEMDSAAFELLAINIERYRRERPPAQAAIGRMLATLGEKRAATLVDLPQVCGMAGERRLLRYPLLLDAPVRDTCLLRLEAAGLGPSVLYPAPLPAIAGLETLFADQGPFPEASGFASRIITLPVHPGVGEEDVAAMGQILARAGDA